MINGVIDIVASSPSHLWKWLAIAIVQIVAWSSSQMATSSKDQPEVTLSFPNQIGFSFLLVP